MTAPVQNPPAGMAKLQPHLICDGAAKAIDFYKAAFGATEMARLAGADGRLMHAAVTINESPVLLVDEFREHDGSSPKALGGTPVSMHLYVDDVDAWVARAVAAGAVEKMPVADMFWGDRFGMIEDPFGHHWTLATPLGAPRSPGEIAAAMRGA